MKLDFRDTLKRDAIDLTFRIQGDDVERDIYTTEAKIKWSLNVEYKNWGIDGFNYELIEMRMPITIDTVLENGETDSTDVQAEVKFNSSPKQAGYICRIYEDVLKDGKWVENVFASFPINISVEESPATEENNRSQIFVKYLELNLDGEDRKLVLTI
jgi:hypothetical protein